MRSALLKCAVIDCKDGVFKYVRPEGVTSIDSIISGVCDQCAAQGYQSSSGGGSSYVFIMQHGVCIYMYDALDPARKKCKPPG